MRNRIVCHGLAVGAALLLSAASGTAQTCNGAASFARGPVRVGAGAEFTDGARSYGAQAAVGAAAGPFATATLSAVNYDDVNEGGTAIGLSAGYSVPMNPTKTAEFCPVVGYSRQTGPNVVTSAGKINVSGTAFSFGGVVGAIVSSSPQFDFIPFLGGAYTTSKFVGTIGSVSSSSSSNYWQFDVGGGFILNKVLTIRPSVSLPVGLDDADPVYGVAFAFNFGTAPSAAMKRR